MKLEDALNQWGLWIINGGCVSSKEMSELVAPADSVVAGETSNRMTSKAIYDDSVVKTIDEQIKTMRERWQSVLAVEYAGLKLLDQMTASDFLGISRNTYKTELSKAKKWLRVTFHYQ